MRFAREYEEQGFPRGLWWDSSSYEFPGKLTSKNLGRSVVVNLTNIISPTMTNEILFSASKLKLNYDFAEPDKVSYAGLVLKESASLLMTATTHTFRSACITWGSGDLHTAYGYPILGVERQFCNHR